VTNDDVSVHLRADYLRGNFRGRYFTRLVAEVPATLPRVRRQETFQLSRVHVLDRHRTLPGRILLGNFNVDVQ
jgi:hypothetical protein